MSELEHGLLGLLSRLKTTPRKQFAFQGGEEEALAGRIGHPQPIRGFGMEMALHQVPPEAA